MPTELCLVASKHQTLLTLNKNIREPSSLTLLLRIISIIKVHGTLTITKIETSDHAWGKSQAIRIMYINVKTKCKIREEANDCILDSQIVINLK